MAVVNKMKEIDPNRLTAFIKFINEAFCPSANNLCNLYEPQKKQQSMYEHCTIHVDAYKQPCSC